MVATSTPPSACRTTRGWSDSSVPEIVLGKGSGLDNVTDHLEQHGLTATEEQKSDLLLAVKSASLAKHELLTADEFRELARSVGIH